MTEREGRRDKGGRWVEADDKRKEGEEEGGNERRRGSTRSYGGRSDHDQTHTHTHTNMHTHTHTGVSHTLTRS